MRKHPIPLSAAVLCAALMLLTGCKNTDSSSLAGTVQAGESAASQENADTPSEESAADSARTPETPPADRPADEQNAQTEQNAASGETEIAQGDVTAPAPAADSAAESTSAQKNTGSGQTQPAVTDGGQSGGTKPVGSAAALYGTDLTAKPGQKRVPVTVSVANNPGFCFAGIRIQYDPELSPVLESDDQSAVYEAGPVLQGMLSVCAVNQKKCLVGMSAAATDNSTANGALFTCYFDIPEKAESGRVYTFSVSAKDAMNEAENAVTFEAGKFRLTVQ